MSIRRNENDYYIKDLIPEELTELKLIFIFESPHNSEVLSGIPVSGTTGKNIMKQLELKKYDEDDFGHFIKNNYNHNTAIINIYNKLLQKLKCDSRDSHILSKYAFIRKNYSALLHHRDKAINEMEKSIINKFKAKLKMLVKQSNITIIVCGKFAQTYFESAFPTREHICLPHPARSGWNKIDDSQITFLKGIFLV